MDDGLQQAPRRELPTQMESVVERGLTKGAALAFQSGKEGSFYFYLCGSANKQWDRRHGPSSHIKLPKRWRDAPDDLGCAQQSVGGGGAVTAIGALGGAQHRAKEIRLGRMGKGGRGEWVAEMNQGG
jgi:hypothetical protein